MPRLKTMDALLLVVLLVAVCFPAASGLAASDGGGLRKTLLPTSSFESAMEELRSLGSAAGGRGEEEEEKTSEVHIRYTDSPAGVLRYAAARGQPVEEVADLLLAQFDGDPDSLHRRAASASSRVAAALASPDTRRLRVDQLEAPVQTTGSDGGGGSADAEKMGRLYYSAILAAASSLADFRLPEDVLGLCTLLALSRAALAQPRPRRWVALWSKRPERRTNLDAAVTDHFHGVLNNATDGRFSLVERFWEPPSPPMPPPSRRSAGAAEPLLPRPHKLLVVAFSSLGDGIVRHEWRRALRAALDATIDLDALPGSDPWPVQSVDVLFAADPAVSWYCTDARGRWDDGQYFRERLMGVLLREQEEEQRHHGSGGRRRRRSTYDGVLFLGDSMGGSAALRFASLGEAAAVPATRAVAFVPQVDLVEDDHVSRDDFTVLARRKFQQRLLRSVETATAVRRRSIRGRLGAAGRWWRKKQGKCREAGETTVVIHRGTDARDAAHASLVCAHRKTSAAIVMHTTAERWRSAPPSSSSNSGGGGEGGGVVVVEHAECADHLLTTWLKGRGELDALICLEIKRVLDTATDSRRRGF